MPLEPTKNCARVKKTCVDGTLTSYLNLGFGFSKEGCHTLRSQEKSCFSSGTPTARHIHESSVAAASQLQNRYMLTWGSQSCTGEGDP